MQTDDPIAAEILQLETVKLIRVLITINVPLFKKLRDIIFFGGGESLYEPFRGTFARGTI